MVSGIPGLFVKSLDFGLIPELIRPYRANRDLKSQPDFFEEKYPESPAELESLAQKFPEKWQIWDKLGFAYAKEIEQKDNTGKKVVYPDIAEKSVAAYLKAHQLNPRAFGPPNNIGNIYYTLRSPAQAIEWWNIAIAVNPNAVDSRLNLAIAYYYKGQVKESSQQLEEVLKRDPHNKTALVMLKRMVE